MRQRYEHMQASIPMSGSLDLSPEDDGWELCGVEVNWFDAFRRTGYAYWKHPVGDWARGFDRPEQESKEDFS